MAADADDDSEGRLPQHEEAIILRAKLHDDLLSSSHPDGRSKALFFARLGYSPKRWRELERELKRLIARTRARAHPLGPYGQKYIVRGTIRGPWGRSARIVTIWIVTSSGKPPRFVTALARLSNMTFKLLDSVVLEKDLPRLGLKRDDLGTIVELYEPDGVEVEFLTLTGKTKAVVTLTNRDLRPIGDDDLHAVRRLRRRR